MHKTFLTFFAFAIFIFLTSCGHPSYVKKENAAVGDILLQDGRFASADEYSAKRALFEKKNGGAIGVVFYTGGDGRLGQDRILCSGLPHNEHFFQWAWYDYDSWDPEIYSTGYMKNFSEIQCLAELDEYGMPTFYGDFDGSDNFEKIKIIDKKGTSSQEKIQKNYPAFYFAMAAFGEGFYLPTFAELFWLWKNLAAVNSALRKIGADEFVEGQYWSSSQSKYDNAAWSVMLGENDYNFEDNPKYMEFTVIGIITIKK